MPARIIHIDRLRPLTRLRRINPLSAWDELDAMSLVPPTLRPRVAVPRSSATG